MSSRIIKICGITNAEDAEAAIAAGANAIGFNFYPRSKRYIAPEAAAPIARGLNVLKVGVFVNETAARVEAIRGQVGLDIAQLHGDESAAGFPDGRVWKALRIEAGFSSDTLKPYSGAEAFLLDGPAGAEFGGAGVPFDWSLAQGLTRPIIIAGGLDASNVAIALRRSHAWGVDACSRLESVPGRKDHRKMIQFIQAALAAETAS